MPPEVGAQDQEGRLSWMLDKHLGRLVTFDVVDADPTDGMVLVEARVSFPEPKSLQTPVDGTRASFPERFRRLGQHYGVRRSTPVTRVMFQQAMSIQDELGCATEAELKAALQALRGEAPAPESPPPGG